MIWEVEISDEKFDKVNSTASFSLLIRLGRMMNQLNSNFSLFLASNELKTSAQNRDYFSSFCQICSILAECLKENNDSRSLWNSLKREFGDKAWFTSFEAFFTSPEAREVSSIVSRIRNQITFHFDDFASPVLANSYLGRLFLTADGQNDGSVYFLMADNIAWSFIEAEVSGSREEIINKIIDVLVKFDSEIKNIISEITSELEISPE